MRNRELTPDSMRLGLGQSVLTEPAKPGKPRLERRVSFAIALAAAMGVLVLIAVVSVIAIQWSAALQNTVGLLNQMTALALERIEAGIADHLDPAEVQIEQLGALIEAENIELDDHNRLGALLEGALSGTPQVAGIAVWGPDLQQFVVARSPEGGLLKLTFDRSGDQLTTTATLEMEKTVGAFWGDLLRGESGVTLVNLRRALRRSGEVFGYMASVITVPELSKLVSETGELYDATTFVLYGADRVLAHPALIDGESTDPGAEPAIAIDGIGDPVLAAIWQGRPLRQFKAVAADQISVVEIGLEQGSFVAAYRWIDRYGEVPWAVGVWLAREDALTELFRLRFAGIAGIAVLLLAVVFAIILGKLIARPIRHAANVAALVGDLEIDRVDRLPASRILELDDQSRAFNTMLGSLRSFETYVPRSLVSRLIRRGGDAEVESAERELTVLFTDIVGYTSMAEGMPAADIADFLNQHFALLGHCVESEGGTVDKFIGDALMAFWGAPDPQKDHAARAIRAAQSMVDALEKDNQDRMARGLPPVRVRIGIHTGPVVVGNIGWPGRINYTIVGDTVNTCQRIEMLGKEMDVGDAVTVLISEATARQLDDNVQIRPAGRFNPKGKALAVEVFRLQANR